MQRTVRNNVISIHEMHNKGFKLIAASLVLLLVILGGIGVILFQTPLNQPQDIRPEASVATGVVLTSFSTNPTIPKVGDEVTTSIKVNTQGKQVTGFQWVFNIVGTKMSTPELVLAPNTGLNLIHSEVEQTQDGYLVSIAAVPTVITAGFRSSTPTAIVEVKFTPYQPNAVLFNFDVEKSKSFLSGTDSLDDQLKIIEPYRLAIAANQQLSQCTYTLSDWSSCISNRQTRKVTERTPANCTGGGDPILTQACQSQDNRQQGNSSSDAKTSINWQNNDVSLSAENFYLIANGIKFNLPQANFILNSDSPSGDTDGYTTLETTWQERGTEMKLFIYFKHDGNEYWSNEMRMYNGANPGNWIYFIKAAGTTTVAEQKNDSFFRTKLGDIYNRTGVSSFTSSQSGVGEIHFENLKLQAFKQFGRGTGGYATKKCNESCSSNSECGVNQRCSSNRCRLVTNLSSETCSGLPDQGLQRQCNEYCADSHECASGFSCYYNRCRAPLNPESQTCSVNVSAITQQAKSCNQTCGSNKDCAVNMRCYHGQCRLATNPSSGSCSAASKTIVSTPLYGGTNKGSTSPDGDGNDSPKATPPPAPVAEPSITPSITPTATPSFKPSTPQPTVSPAIEPIATTTAWDSLLENLDQRGLSIRTIGLVAGGILLILIILFALSKLLSRKPNKPTPPTNAQNQKQMASLENRISELKQQPQAGKPTSQTLQPQAAPTPLATTPPAVTVTATPVNTPPPSSFTAPAPMRPAQTSPMPTPLPMARPMTIATPLPLPLARPASAGIQAPVAPLAPVAPVQPISPIPPLTQPTTPLAPVQPIRPAAVKQAAQDRLIRQTPSPFQSSAQPVVKPVTSQPAPIIPPPPAAAPKPSLLSPSHIQSLPQPKNQVPTILAKPDQSKGTSSSMLARIRAKGLVTEENGSKKIFDSTN